MWGRAEGRGMSALDIAPLGIGLTTLIKFCHNIHNEHWTEDKVVKSHMWVPSSVGSLQRAHWQLKTQEISFFPQIKKVLIFMIIDFMCFIFLLEEPILGNISSSSEVTNSRRNIPMGCERGNRQWT